MLLSTLRGEDVSQNPDPHIRMLGEMSPRDLEHEMVRNWQSVRSMVAWNAPHLDRNQQIYYGLSNDESLKGITPSFIAMLEHAQEHRSTVSQDEMIVTKVMPSTGVRSPEPDEQVSTGVILYSNRAHYLVEMGDLSQGEIYQPREVVGLAGQRANSIWTGIHDALIDTPENAVSGRFYTKSLRDDRAGPVLLTGIPEQTQATDQETTAAVGAINLYAAQHEWQGRPRSETTRLVVNEPTVSRQVFNLDQQAMAMNSLGATQGF